MRLTEISVRALKGSENHKTYFDDTLPGFGVRVGLRRRTFLVVRGRNRERITIGQWPDMTVGDARTEAKKLLAGEQEPRTIRRTFLEARDEFVGSHYVGKSDYTRYQVTRSLTLHCARLERVQLADIDDDHLARVLNKVVRGPSASLAEEAVQAAVETCKSDGYAVAAVVVDQWGHVKALLVADGALDSASRNAQAKATVSAIWNQPSGAVGAQAKTQDMLAQRLKNDPNELALPGGLPISVGGRLIGAIGEDGLVQGDKEEACAKAGIDKIADRLS